MDKTYTVSTVHARKFTRPYYILKMEEPIQFVADAAKLRLEMHDERYRNYTE